MGYGYAETFLVVFLTHPGVIIPTISSVGSKLTSFIPPDAAGVVPPELTSLVEGGIPAPISGLWQVLWVWILSLPGERSAAFGWTMYALYIMFLLAYMYFAMPLRISQGI
jgi:hypothetical protein